jgi:DNA modification methylase
MSRITPKEAKLKLEQDYILLPVGSYYKWLEPEWFARYKEILVYKNSAWIISTDKIHLLRLMDQKYNEYKFKQYYQEQIVREEMDSLIGVNTTPKLNKDQIKQLNTKLDWN